MKTVCVILMMFIFIPVIFANQTERGELIAFIKDFLVRLGQPLRLTTSELCWKRADFIALTKLLLANNFQITPSKSKLSSFWPHEQQMILLDMSCKNATETLANANKTSMLSEPFKWLIIEDSIKQTLDPSLEIYVNSKIYIIQKHEKGFKVISKYRINSDYDYFTNDVAMWERNKFVYYNQLLDSRNRSNLHGIMLNISVAILNPDTIHHLLDLKDRHIEATTKVTYPLVLHLVEYLNITSTDMYRPTWGYKQPNETYFNGIVGDMQNKSTEIAGSAIIPVQFRVPYIQYVGCFTYTRARFVFRAPSLSSVQNVYMLPFETTVWLASIGIVFIAALILYIISLWETDPDFLETPKNSVSKLAPTMSNMLQLQIGAVCQQGSEAEPIGMAGRVATIVLFISSLFLFTSYSANIVALLQSTSDNIRTLQDLIDSRIELGAENISYNVFFFKVEKHPVKKALYQKKVAPPGEIPHFLSIEDGVKKIKDEFYAFHTEVTSIYKIVSDTFNEHEKCSLVEMDYFGFSGPPSFAIRKNTSNAELIKAGYHKLSERGMQSRWFKKIYYEKPTCASQAGTFLSVSLLDCYAPFLIFGTGIACALIVFTIEHIHSKIKIWKADRIIDLRHAERVNTISGDFVNLSEKMMKSQIMITPSKNNLSMYWPHEQQMFILDLACNNSKELLLSASKENLLELPFRWLILNYNNDTDLLPNLQMYVGSKIYLLQKLNGGRYKLLSKYRLGIAIQQYRSDDIALWSNGAFIYYNKLIDAKNRTNLDKLDINSTIVVLTKLQEKHLLDGKYRHVNPATKANFILSLHMFDCINATPHYKIRRSWGIRDPKTGEFNGMMGDLQQKTIEVCGGPMFINKDRLMYIQGIGQTGPTNFKFVFKAPPLPLVTNVYTLPFNSSVWLACFAIIAINPIVFYIIAYWEQHSVAFNEHEKSRNSVQRLYPKTIDMLQLQMGAVCQQGSEAEPISIAGRIATIFLFIAMLFLYTSYSANIVGLLQSTSNSIQTVNDLLHSDIELGVEDMQYNRYYFAMKAGEVYKAIYTKKIIPPGKRDAFMDFNTGMKRMRSSFFAFHAEISTVYDKVAATFLEHEKCALREIDYMNLQPPVIIMRKNTTYGELFRAAILKIIERGLANRSCRRIFVKKPTCESSGGIFMSVSLLDCYPAFVVFGYGVMVSLVILVFEIVVHKRKLYKSRNYVIDLRNN